MLPNLQQSSRKQHSNLIYILIRIIACILIYKINVTISDKLKELRGGGVQTGTAIRKQR